MRLLGLQAQLYETETINPELALPGPFDFAFVLIYLAPPAVIVLMHDLVSGEREAGRLRVLSALPATPDVLWLQRARLRLVLVLLALLAPFLSGAVIAQAPVAGVAALGLVGVLYVAFWTGLGLLVGAWGRRSAFNAATLRTLSKACMRPWRGSSARGRHASGVSSSDRVAIGEPAKRRRLTRL